jgi:hypothetical protein
MKTLFWSSNLVLASRDGCSKSEYRVKDNQVEIRCATGDENSGWRPLSRDELWRHFALNTPVAHWLRRRPA